MKSLVCYVKALAYSGRRGGVYSNYRLLTWRLEGRGIPLISTRKKN